MKKILVTGSSGFIGYHLCKYLLANHKVLGIDSMDDYYEISLKIFRNKLLKKNKNFIFKKIDISNLSKINSAINDFEPNIIIHLAGQAGVRYSIENPEAYLNSNIKGTFNILESIKNISIDHFMFSSTSSIYGQDVEQPYKEINSSDFQLSFYAASKKSCESIIHSYSHLYNIPATCFRFFTVYGPFGRPDMAYFKFTKSILQEKTINVHNNGNMMRDFTYIDDLIKSINLLMVKKPEDGVTFLNDSLSPSAPFRVINIGNSKKISLTSFISCLEDILNKKAKLKFVPNKRGELIETFSSSDLLFQITGFKPNLY